MRMPPEYRPLHSHAAWARRGLIGALLAAVAAIVVDAFQFGLLVRLSYGAAGAADWDANETRQAIVALGQAVLVLIAGGLFLRWFHRAYGNLGRLGAEPLRFGRGWAVAAWFVPVLNLIRPKQMANDVWRASDPEGDDLSWRAARVPPWVHAWWGALLVSGLLGRLAASMWDNAGGLDQLKAATGVSIAANIAAVGAALLALRLVRGTTERQQARAARLSARY